MTPLPVPTPQEYRRYPIQVLERWADIAWKAKQYTEASVIRSVIAARDTQEIAA